MKHRIHSIATITALAGVFAVASCSKRESKDEHLSFNAPEEAETALIAALEKNDVDGLRRLLGPVPEELLTSGDEVADRAPRERFLERYRERHQFVAGSPNDLVLQVGEDNWPLPIPLVRNEGKWRFDGAAGTDEILLRRIGANELRTIDVMRGYVAAQEDYAAAEHDGLAAGVYARKLRSEPGKHDGLYWKVSAGEPQSPAGPMLAAAAAEGYTGSPGARTPYHGYNFRMLFAQGPAASGGARSYLEDGKLTGGFALIAAPETYGASGVMTFVVNQDGVVWQRDLGEKTAEVAATIESFNPDETWTPIAPDG
jgi:hypothetical protein